MASISPGTIIDRRYVVGDRIGRGGMGEVYAARQQGIGGFERRVALKIVRPEVGDEENIDRLLTEAKLLSQLHHPSIVSVLDVDRDENLLYVIMELLEGLNLARVVRSGPPPLAVTLEILLRACEGLAYAH